VEVDEFAERITQRMAGEEPTEEEVEKPETTGDSPVEEEAPPAEEEEVVEGTAESEALLAGRYKSVEDLERAVEEKEQMLTRQGNEIGELRSMVEQSHNLTQQEIAQMRSDAFEPDEEWEEWADGEIMRGTESGEGDLTAIEAITAAGAEGGPEAARYVLKRWYELDPAAATTFQIQAITHANAILASQQMEHEQSSENGEPAPEIVAMAWQGVEVRHTDVREYEDAMREVLAGLSDSDRARWEQKISGDPSAGEDFVEYLYLQARTREAEGRLSKRDAATAKARREKADREAVGDTVASATASPTRAAPVPKVRGFDYEAFRREAGLTPRE
jgi:hypothetical protein